MNVIESAVGRVFDLALAPLAGAPAWGMLVVSVVTAAWALLLFKKATPQKRLAAARDRLLGHIYEMGLYQDHLAVVGRIQRDLAGANLRYLAASLPALLALALPMALTLGQLDSRYAHRPLQVGETTVLSVTLDAAAADRLDELSLQAAAGVVVEAGPVRDRRGGAAAWRLGARADGAHAVRVMLDGAEVAARTVHVGGGLPRLGEASGSGWLQRLVVPDGDPLPGGGPVRATRLQLPAREVRYLGVELHWLAAFMILSLAGGLALKGVLKVEV